MADEPAVIWAISNRQDDRVVLFERDPAHPGGEAFLGGSGPDMVARTPEVERLLRSGEIVEIPEPPDGRKKPLTDLGAAYDAVRADQPGQRVRLGRAMDPELVPPGAMSKVERQQADAPDELPLPQGVVVPPEPEAQRESRRR